MAHLNVYVPDKLEKKIKKEAKREGKSVSAFVLAAVRFKIEPTQWNPEFLGTFGSWKGEIPKIKNLPLQKRPALDKL